MRPISTFLDSRVRESLAAGIVIPAHPLALTASRRLDERRQRGLTRYYLDAGVGGLAVGVHTTQFAIRNPSIGLFRPVLELAAEEMDHADTRRAAPVVRIGGICGTTTQAVSEAVLLREYGYHLGLLSLSALKLEDVDALIEHCRCIGEVIPLVGFYLQEAVGGRHLPYEFWRRLCELDSLAAIKIAPFNRYRTLDVVRAVIDSGRDDVALYTGNDDNIVADLLTAYRYPRNGERVERRIVGGLLGHWSVWTMSAVEQHRRIRSVDASGSLPADLLRLSGEVTDANGAFFDAANQFRGVIAGLHEVLRRQGLLEGIWCLDESETLGPGQSAEIDRVYAAYPHLNDDEFVAENRQRWLSG